MITAADVYPLAVRSPLGFASLSSRTTALIAAGRQRNLREQESLVDAEPRPAPQMRAKLI